ncbi:MAG: hypothetical protein WCO63_13215 [Bacteroidota bacterium]
MESQRKQLSSLKLIQISGGYDFRILLPDYDLEVAMTPLCKTLYLFFLRHESGILLKNLSDHTAELMKIYERISNLSDRDKLKTTSVALPISSWITQSTSTVPGSKALSSKKCLMNRQVIII